RGCEEPGGHGRDGEGGDEGDDEEGEEHAGPSSGAVLSPVNRPAASCLRRRDPFGVSGFPGSGSGRRVPATATIVSEPAMRNAGDNAFRRYRVEHRDDGEGRAARAGLALPFRKQIVLPEQKPFV